MISSNALSTSILHHNLNGISDKNLHSIRYLTCTSGLSRNTFKHVCKDFPNMAILIKIATPGKAQLTFVHASVGNKSLGESITDFTLAGLLKAPKVVSIESNTAFINAGNSIRITITKVLICAASGDLERSKKQRDWVVLNVVLLPPFLTESAILESEEAAANLLKVFAKCIEGKRTEEEEDKL